MGNDAYLGEIVQLGFSFAPLSFAICSGRKLKIAQNSKLFALFGTVYGGDGRHEFGLPDLRVRSATGAHRPFTRVGKSGGYADKIVHKSALPTHTHEATFIPDDSQTRARVRAATALATDARSDGMPIAPPRPGVEASGTPGFIPADQAEPTVMLGGMTGGGGAAKGHVELKNSGEGRKMWFRSPYLVINFAVCLSGPFPSHS
ncbi:tail fiber protein [Nisaea acidiphila]|uniref:Tail fiber protein n=1 Tax=Nisaea acidiphila TaxID=1862145 RepID=A0A9J7AN76_9PROT|nr:tail fiber protein [Nisaea acidiphila]UUX48896.1 tail fiber protein [Nisaea acidiphila]